MDTQSSVCANCNSVDTPTTCSVCKNVRYCSRKCQVADWKAKHKYVCKKQDTSKRSREAKPKKQTTHKADDPFAEIIAKAKREAKESKSKNAKQEEVPWEDMNDEQRALATVAQPGTAVDPEDRQLCRIDEIPPEIVSQIRAHPAMVDFPHQTQTKIIEREGVDFAVAFAEHARHYIATMVNLAKSKGIEVRPDDVPLWNRVAHFEQFNPRMHMVGVPGNKLPFELSLPFSYAQIRQVQNRDKFLINEMLMFFPFLPMPMVPNKLPHVLLPGTTNYIVHNSFEWLNHLICAWNFFKDTADVVSSSVQHDIHQRHLEHQQQISQIFERETDALLAEAKEVGKVTTSMLIKLDQICMSHQLDVIRLYECSVVDYLMRDNQMPESKKVKKPQDLKHRFETQDSKKGIPPEYRNCMFSTSMLVNMIEHVHANMVEEILAMISGVQQQRKQVLEGEEMWKQWGESYENDPEVASVGSKYYTLDQLFEHWKFVFCDTKYSDTTFFQKKEKEVEHALMTMKFEDMPKLISPQPHDLICGEVIKS